MGCKYISMSQKEVKRYQIIKKSIDRQIGTQEASSLLNLTTRQIRRLKVRVKEFGLKGLIHLGRGKQSNRKMLKEERQRIKDIVNEKYSDFGPTLACEKLRENHKIDRDEKTIRSIMIEDCIWKPKQRKKEKYHSWRQRRSNYGEMEQYDGSYHLWFEDRGPECCLLAAIDDASGNIYARFDQHEGVNPTFSFWKRYIKERGKPHSAYVDRFSTYSMNHKLAKENPDTLTQFQRAMKQLNIEVIKAYSSQAKGRVENLFGTLQDRLVKELRLNNISTIPEANDFLEKVFLPKFNAKFNVQPTGKTNLHIKLTKKEEVELESIFSRHTQRTVRNDYTISYKNDWYQLEENQPTNVFKKENITVEERTDGAIHLRLRGKYLNFKKLPARPEKIAKKNIPWVLAKKTVYRPAIDHPWRKYQYAKN